MSRWNGVTDSHPLLICPLTSLKLLSSSKGHCQLPDVVLGPREPWNLAPWGGLIHHVHSCFSRDTVACMGQYGPWADHVHSCFSGDTVGPHGPAWTLGWSKCISISSTSGGVAPDVRRD